MSLQFFGELESILTRHQHVDDGHIVRDALCRLLFNQGHRRGSILGEVVDHAPSCHQVMENHSVRFIVVDDQHAPSGQLCRRHDGQGRRGLFEELRRTPERTAVPRLTGDSDLAAHLLDELF